MSKDNIIGRIRKLLAIADKNSGASENEMMTEMSMAQALMLRHHLSPQVQSSSDAPLSAGGSPPADPRDSELGRKPASGTQRTSRWTLYNVRF